MKGKEWKSLNLSASSSAGSVKMFTLVIIELILSGWASESSNGTQNRKHKTSLPAGETKYQEKP